MSAKGLKIGALAAAWLVAAPLEGSAQSCIQESVTHGGTPDTRFVNFKNNCANSVTIFFQCGNGENLTRYVGACREAQIVTCSGLYSFSWSAEVELRPGESRVRLCAR